MTALGEEPFAEVFQRFLRTVDTTCVSELLFGYWGDDIHGNGQYPVDMLVEVGDRFPALRLLYVGDMESDEMELSRIEHGDITPLFGAFPALESLEICGASGLKLGPVRNKSLKLLRFESVGLPAEVAEAVSAADLPNLRDLDLWLGRAVWGGDATVSDLAGILDGQRLPSLRHLGLENSEIADEIASQVASAPIVARLESLSLGLGTISDLGAEALLNGQSLTHLKQLDLRYSYLTDPMAERIRAAMPNTEIDFSGQRRRLEGGRRYVAISE
ncbi:STM4015 family protein [Actinopolymorpha alba]|uniref:STM4015 family protein n=1 Tax=Actinopolymorpha alba TaxID=533267 RepID=UPI00192A85AE|nr:STM4015 family protein [Actinopolymorpha alba]